MAVPTAITDLSVTAASNSPAGADTATSNTGPDDYFRALFALLRREQAQGADVASATTIDLGAIADGNYVHITGTTTITGFGTVAAGIERTLVFTGILTLTHNATSLILRTGANRTTAAGDVGVFVSEGSGNWREKTYHAAATSYQASDATLTALASALTAANKIPYATATDTLGELDFSTNTSLGTSDTTLSSQKAVKTYIDARGGMTLLGTDTTTSLSGRTFSGLSLSTYKFVLFQLEGVGHTGGTTDALLLDSIAVSGAISPSNAVSGMIWVSLNTGYATATLADSSTPTAGTVAVVDTAYDTTTTDITFSWANSRDFDAGTIRCWGVK